MHADPTHPHDADPPHGGALVSPPTQDADPHKVAPEGDREGPDGDRARGLAVRSEWSMVRVRPKAWWRR